MMYNRDDIVKLDLGVQQVPGLYRVLCPYVRVKARYNDEASGMLFAEGTFIRDSDGNRVTTLFSFVAANSTLYST